jgi:hypothetical protein
MDFEEAFDISTIQLEPRLQEYMRRKNFNEENNIEPEIPEEQEFCITPHDMKIMKRFNQGKKKLYTSKRLNQDPHFVKTETHDFEKMHDFKADPRFERIKKRMAEHKKAQQQIRNLDNMDEDYEIFYQTNPYDMKPEKRPQKISKPFASHGSNQSGQRQREQEDDEDELSSSDNDMFMMDSRDMVLGTSRTYKNKKNHTPDRGQYCYNPNVRSNNPNTYHHTPDITYKQRLAPFATFGSRGRGNDDNDDNYMGGQLSTFNDHQNYSRNNGQREQLQSQRGFRQTEKSRGNGQMRFSEQRPIINGGLEHSRNVDEIIGNLDQYNKHLNNSYEYIDNNFDQDTRTFTPGSRSRTRTQREMTHGYQSVPFMYGNGLPDVTLEESLRGGIRDSSKKSIGFRNPFEHSFDYISGDISDPSHSVQMWPQSTRGENKEMARPGSMSVRSERRIGPGRR